MMASPTLIQWMWGVMADFASILGNMESGGNYNAQNSLGYTGKYQWGQARLDDFARANGMPPIDMATFKANPALQEAAQAWAMADIDRAISANHLETGGNINGVPITRDGMQAVAHLGGINGLIKFIRSNGTYNPADANGTRLSDYLAKGGGFNAQNMPPMSGVQQQPQASGFSAESIRKAFAAAGQQKPVEQQSQQAPIEATRPQPRPAYVAGDSIQRAFDTLNTLKAQRQQRIGI
jgi:hypothetical protein